MTSENLTPETFNVLDVLSGVAYPSDTVTVHLNAMAARESKLLREQIALEFGAQGDGEGDGEDDDTSPIPADIVAKLNELRDAVQASELTFHLRGIPVEVDRACRAKARAKFPDKKLSVQGMEIPVPSDDQDEFYQLLILEAHVEKITNAAGATHERPSADELSKIMPKLPGAAANKVIEAVNSLKVDAEEFEAAVSDDFLAKH